MHELGDLAVETLCLVPHGEALKFCFQIFFVPLSGGAVCIKVRRELVPALGRLQPRCFHNDIRRKGRPSAQPQGDVLVSAAVERWGHLKHCNLQCSMTIISSYRCERLLQAERSARKHIEVMVPCPLE